MNLELSAADLAFQAEVRDFVRNALPPEVAERNRRLVHLPKQDYITWHRLLHKRGWGAPNWPKEHGGPGWTPVQRHIFDEECAAADAPALLPFGISMVGPVIYTFGTPEQKAYYLPRILSMEDWWCQGYSEPGSGSDLASLRTRAEADGDDYIVNGHKIWTTLAHFADMMFCLVRTDPQAKPQEGISFLLIDMKTPGITVRPIISIDEGHGVNEVFLDNVRVPKANRIGQEGKGWTYAKFLLGNERTTIAEVATSKQRLRRLKAIAKAEALLDEPSFRDKVAARGVGIELVPGILPVSNVAQTRRFAGQCGASIPDWMDRLFEGLDELPEARKLVAATIAGELCGQLYAGGVRDFHFYTLNRAELAYAICHMLGVRA